MSSGEKGRSRNVSYYHYYYLESAIPSQHQRALHAGQYVIMSPELVVGLWSKNANNVDVANDKVNFGRCLVYLRTLLLKLL